MTGTPLPQRQQHNLLLLSCFPTPAQKRNDTPREPLRKTVLVQLEFRRLMPTASGITQENSQFVI